MKRSEVMQQVELGSLLHAQAAIGVDEPNQWECLQVWHAWDDMQASWGDERHEHVNWRCGQSCLDDACVQGWQPYVGLEEQFDIPFNPQGAGSHDIQLGVDRLNSQVFELACRARWGNMGADGKPWKQSGSSEHTEDEGTSEQAPCSSMSEQLVETASDGTCLTSAQSGRLDQGQTEMVVLMQQSDQQADVNGAFNSKMLRDSRGMKACTNGKHSLEDAPNMRGESRAKRRGKGQKGHCALLSQSGQARLDLLLTGPWKPQSFTCQMNKLGIQWAVPAAHSVDPKPGPFRDPQAMGTNALSLVGANEQKSVEKMRSLRMKISMRRELHQDI